MQSRKKPQQRNDRNGREIKKKKKGVTKRRRGGGLLNLSRRQKGYKNHTSSLEEMIILITEWKRCPQENEEYIHSKCYDFTYLTQKSNTLSRLLSMLRLHLHKGFHDNPFKPELSSSIPLCQALLICLARFIFL